jgi:hypothetical protein
MAKAANPCGLVAKSFFNDTYALCSLGEAGTPLPADVKCVDTKIDP